MFVRRLALAIALLAGLIGSQGPEFAQQYRQRLGGGLDELNRMVSEFDGEVQRQNLTRAEGLSRLDRNDDPLARERGQDIGNAINRAKRLNDQIEAMNSAGPFMRLYVVATNFDPEIAHSTLDNYEPAAPLAINSPPPPLAPARLPPPPGPAWWGGGPPPPPRRGPFRPPLPRHAR